jgi:hypothetical protein
MFNDLRNRAATLRVDFSFRWNRRSGSRNCSLRFPWHQMPPHQHTCDRMIAFDFAAPQKCGVR